MIEDGTGSRHHAKAFGDVGTVIPPIILYRKAHYIAPINRGHPWGVLFLL